MKPQLIGYNAAGQQLYLERGQRNFHHHVIGSSGGGKSKYLEFLMRGDTVSGQGFCLIDPHGTLYSDVLEFCAFRVLKREIILLDLSDPQYIVGFNFFTKEKTGKTNVQVDNLIGATLHAWNAKNSDATPTLGRTLKVIYTSMLDAEMSLPQIAQLLDFQGAKLIKEDLAARIENDLIRREWLELASLSKLGDFRNEILSTKNRLFPFLTSNTLLQFIGIKGKTIDLLEAMNEQKIILVNLAQSENLSLDESRLFGSLLVNQFFQSALKRRKDALGRDPQAYKLYLDEFQNIVSIDLADMLDQVRKFGLFLTLSHQRFGHLDEDMEDSVLTNCRIKTVFGGLRTEDAERMAKELFIGQLDPKKIKAAIYQTKHWYKYVRERVYSKSSGYTESETDSQGSGISSGSGRQNSSSSGGGKSLGSSYGMEGTGGQMMLPANVGSEFTGAMWFSEGASLSQAESAGSSDMESHSNFSGQASGRSWSESESIADIPVFVPVPYQELSSVQYYTPEEQLLELTQALKLQQQRHCFIQLPNQETQPVLVPFVNKFYVSKENLNWYVKRLAEKANALTPAQADQLISQARQDSLQSKDTAQIDIQNSPEKPTDIIAPKTDTSKKKTILERMKEANPDLDI